MKSDRRLRRFSSFTMPEFLEPRQLLSTVSAAIQSARTEIWLHRIALRIEGHTGVHVPFDPFPATTPPGGSVQGLLDQDTYTPPFAGNDPGALLRAGATLGTAVANGPVFIPLADLNLVFRTGDVITGEVQFNRAFYATRPPGSGTGIAPFLADHATIFVSDDPTATVVNVLVQDSHSLVFQANGHRFTFINQE